MPFDKLRYILFKHAADVAQLVEHFIGNEEVGSSNLLISSSKKAVPKGTAFLLEKRNIYVSSYPEAPIVMKGFFDGAQSAAK